MSNDKSKAVQIAEKLSPDLPTILRIDAEAAGDELRRLDAVNRELLEALARLRGACRGAGWLTDPAHRKYMDEAREAIAKATDV